jgi:hypothetical protein
MASDCKNQIDDFDTHLFHLTEKLKPQLLVYSLELIRLKNKPDGKA